MQAHTIENKEMSMDACFEFRPRRAIWMGALGMTISMLIAIAIAVLWKALLGSNSAGGRIGGIGVILYALMGGMAGGIIGRAEIARRPVLRLAMVGLLGGGLGALIGYFLPSHINQLPYVLCIGAFWGWALGGWKASARVGLYSLLISSCLLMLAYQTQIFFFTDITTLPLIGAFLGWAISREFPASALPFKEHAPIPFKRVVAIVGICLAIPILLCSGSILPRFWHSRSTPQRVVKEEAENHGPGEKPWPGHPQLARDGCHRPRGGDRHHRPAHTCESPGIR